MLRLRIIHGITPMIFQDKTGGAPANVNAANDMDANPESFASVNNNSNDGSSRCSTMRSCSGSNMK